VEWKRCRERKKKNRCSEEVRPVEEEEEEEREGKRRRRRQMAATLRDSMSTLLFGPHTSRRGRVRRVSSEKMRSEMVEDGEAESAASRREECCMCMEGTASGKGVVCSLRLRVSSGPSG
jgi:hypothetical protein